MILLQATSLAQFSGFLGNGIVQAMGGSLFLIGIAILIAIALFAWKFNIHITGTFFLSFIALSFLKLSFNEAQFGNIGLFDTLYNIMLFGIALVFVMFLMESRR